jgi:methylglutaconyl-CoA hydratase
MADVMMITIQQKQHEWWIELNRIDKHNAFSQELLQQLTSAIQQGLDKSEIKALVLHASGRFFSAGADLQDMQHAAELNVQDNIQHAKLLANSLALWHQSHKPTLCLVQGSAFGGALGFIAASDVALATPEATFCFSEAKLGLIPAMISPYILQNMGYKTTKRLFLTAETFDAEFAQKHQLIDEVVAKNMLDTRAQHYLQHWNTLPSQTLAQIKAWLSDIKYEPIGPALIDKTAAKIAEVRTGDIAQQRLQQFLLSRK